MAVTSQVLGPLIGPEGRGPASLLWPQFPWLVPTSELEEVKPMGPDLGTASFLPSKRVPTHAGANRYGVGEGSTRYLHSMSFGRGHFQS